MAEGEFSWLRCGKLALLTLGLMTYELVCFVGCLSLSIGMEVGFTLILKIAIGYDLHVAWQSFTGWYILALTTQIHLRFYRKCIYPKIRNVIRVNRTLMQGLPRVVYFVLYCFSIYGVCHEYEATHGYPPMTLKSKQHNYAEYEELRWATVAPTFLNSGIPSQKPRNRQIIYAQTEFAPVGPDHRVHTFLFLAEMSYLIYSSSQVLSIFLIRLMKDVPDFPLIPQIYATVSMTILQGVLTLFYSFPMVMTLIACHMFHVEALSTYMFTLCLALSVAMAASQLESESPFPTLAKIGPYYYFEGIHRARINLILGFLPPISYYFFQDHKSYPLTANDTNYAMFTFWIMTALMHTVKSLYMTTWRPVPAVPGNINQIQRPADAGGPQIHLEHVIPPAHTGHEGTLSISHEARDNVVVVNETVESGIKESLDDNDGISVEKPKNFKSKKHTHDSGNAQAHEPTSEGAAASSSKCPYDVNAENANLLEVKGPPIESKPLDASHQPSILFELKRSQSDCENKNVDDVEQTNQVHQAEVQAKKQDEAVDSSVDLVAKSPTIPLKIASEDSPEIVHVG